MADSQVLSELYSERLLPNTIIRLIVAAFGIFGNLLVLLLYTKYIEDKTLSRYFIPVLAFVDLVGCVSNTIQFHLSDTMHFNYPDDILCKTMYFFIFFTGGVSAHLILVIALQRYLIICRPFGQQMTNTLCRISILIIFLISFGYSSPSFIFIGVHEYKQLSVGNVSQVAYVCHSDNDSSGIQAMISYLGFLLFLTFINILITSALYIPVIRTIVRTLSPDIPSNHKFQDCDTNALSTDIQISCVENIEMELPEKDMRENNTDHCNKSVVKRNHKQKARQNISIMFFVIIIVYVVSYLTSLGTNIYSFAERGDLDLKGYKFNIYVFCLRINLLNHIANPYIYWFFDKKFRHELRRFCCRVILRR